MLVEAVHQLSIPITRPPAWTILDDLGAEFQANQRSDPVIRRGGGALECRSLRLSLYQEPTITGTFQRVVEVAESPLQAAVREVEEETALTGCGFRWGDLYRETHPYNQGRKVARYYIAESASTEVSLMPNPELGRRSITNTAGSTAPKPGTC